MSRLRPARWDDAKPVIAPMFSLPMADTTAKATIIRNMEVAVEGEPLWAIQQVADAFVSGRLGNGFCPSSAEFGMAIRKLTDPIRQAALRARRERRKAMELDAESEASGPMSEATRARLKAFLAKSASVSAEMSASLKREPEPKAAAAGHMARVAAETAARRATKEQGQ